MRTNLKLDTCLRIFKAFDPKMHDCLVGRPECALDMREVSDYARLLRDAQRGKKNDVGNGGAL